MLQVQSVAQTLSAQNVAERRVPRIEADLCPLLLSLGMHTDGGASVTCATGAASGVGLPGFSIHPDAGNLSLLASWIVPPAY